MRKKSTDAEHGYLKKSHDALKKELTEAMQATSKARADALKQEETVAYLFTRAKSLNGLISGFYTHIYGMKEPEAQKSEYVLSFENMQQKLEKIFRDHEALAKGPNRFDFVEISDVDSVRSGFTSLHNQPKDKRSVSNNATPKQDSIFKSKSPAPSYKGNATFIKDGGAIFGNNVWNEQSRMK